MSYRPITDVWIHAAFLNQEIERLKEQNKQLNSLLDKDWTGALCDRLNSLVRENRKFFDECSDGPSAGKLVQQIHGEFNRLRSELAAAQQERDAARAACGEMRQALELVEFPYLICDTFQKDAEHRRSVVQKALSPTAGQDLLKAAEIGAAWAADSSLEKWFPLTAEELGQLRKRVEAADELAKATEDLIEAKVRQNYWVAHGNTCQALARYNELRKGR